MFHPEERFHTFPIELKVSNAKSEALKISLRPMGLVNFTGPAWSFPTVKTRRWNLQQVLISCYFLQNP